MRITSTQVIAHARRLQARATAYSRASLTTHQQRVWANQAQQWARHAIALTNVPGKPTKAQRKAAVRRWLAAIGRPVLVVANCGAAVRIALQHAYNLRRGVAVARSLRHSATFRAVWVASGTRSLRVHRAARAAMAQQLAAVTGQQVAVGYWLQGWATVLVRCNLL